MMYIVCVIQLWLAMVHGKEWRREDLNRLWDANQKGHEPS